VKILVTADPDLPVPPRLYGGIERVIALLVEGLVARGHEVCLVAHRDSRVPCELVPYADSPNGLKGTLRRTATIASAATTWRPDVIQSFGRLATLAPVLPWATPKVMSYQREITPRAVRWALALAHGTIQFTGCSRRLVDPVATLCDWHVVYNAVPVDTLAFAAGVPADAPLVFLGRVEEIKGPHLAIEVARRAKRRLVLAGNVPTDAASQAFFRREVEPHIDGVRVTYVGPVDDVQKSALLGSAVAFLMPVLWDEPFGIVMAEALACGTPVLGFRRGAVPEVVEDGVTGLVADNVEGLAAVVERAPQLSRAACRAAAVARFSPSALVNAYESIFHASLRRGSTVPATV
jgi:glycosyltransferase involved in cell wall biosynthesis